MGDFLRWILVLFDQDDRLSGNAEKGWTLDRKFAYVLGLSQKLPKNGFRDRKKEAR